MEVPAAMFIEGAQDVAKTREADFVAREVKELHFAIGSGASEEFTNGYLLGLETARYLLATMPAAVEAKVMI